MAVTIKDVAALAGVSASTVSRTCKDSPSISQETKERVRRAMAQLGYEAPVSSDTTAESPRFKSVGIILPPSDKNTYENPFYLEAVRGVSHYCNQHDCMITLITGQDESEILTTIQNMNDNNRIDGFIVLYSKQNDTVVEYLHQNRIIYVLIGKAYQYANQTPYIDNDNVLAGQEATEYLYNRGHRKIAYLGSESTMLYSADRKSGYQLALLRHNLSVNPAYCIETSDGSSVVEQQIKELLTSKERPTAFVVSDDILAVTLKYACQQLGLLIPEDISIISFNNSIFAKMTVPPLTSIDVNSFQLGAEAASAVLSYIQHPDQMATKTIVPHQLVKRKSCVNL